MSSSKLACALLVAVIAGVGCGDATRSTDASQDVGAEVADVEDALDVSESDASELVDVADELELGEREASDVADVEDELDASDSDASDVEVGAEADTSEVEVDAVPTSTALVAAERWTLVPDVRDPFFAVRPEGTVCAPEGLITEAGTLEINTGLCDWPTLEQPLLADIAANAAVEIIFFFASSESAEQAEAALELRFGDEVIWDATFALPTAGGFIVQAARAARAHAAGEQVTFHLHNHGVNTWNLASIALVGGGSE